METSSSDDSDEDNDIQSVSSEERMMPPPKGKVQNAPRTGSIANSSVGKSSSIDSTLTSTEGRVKYLYNINETQCKIPDGKLCSE